jgi:hypothetical protein
MGEHCKVVDDEELGAHVRTQGAIEHAVQLGAVQMVEHPRRSDADDALGRLARLVGERAREERFASAGSADEERVDAAREKAQVVQRQVPGTHLLPRGIEVEVERIDGVDLGEVRVADAPLDGAAQAALLLLVAEAVDHVEGGEVFFRGLREQRRDGLGHAGEPEPAQLLHEPRGDLLAS